MAAAVLAAAVVRLLRRVGEGLREVRGLLPAEGTVHTPAVEPLSEGGAEARMEAEDEGVGVLVAAARTGCCEESPVVVSDTLLEADKREGAPAAEASEPVLLLAIMTGRGVDAAMAAGGAVVAHY